MHLPQQMNDWHHDLQRHCALYRRAPQALCARAVELARRFVKQKYFEGCGGLLVDDTILRTIAFQACLLVAQHGLHCYADLRSVLVYPDEFLISGSDEDEFGVVTEYTEAASGQAVDTARILLSWSDVKLAGAGDGYNVVIHEFAHHLDHALDGVLSAPAGNTPWHALLNREYEALCDAANAGEYTLIDPYGSEDPAEFFAVASEVFIELPRELLARHAELYASLTRLYALDPAEWPSGKD
jgi:Mlc titration factor MtfA (ptsG expression regulator)